MRTTVVGLFSCALLVVVAGCDYPEAGFYELAGLDRSGKAVFSEPFMVEELVSESNLTLAFNILLPREKQLVIAQLENSPDLTRRGWDFRLADRDSGGGDLQLELVHIEDEMSFSGLLRPRGARQSEMFSGSDLRDIAGHIASAEALRPGAVQFSAVPREVADGVERWVLRPITQAQFERALGAPVGNAARRDAAYLSPLRAIQPAASPKPSAAEERPRVRPGRFRRDSPR